jgi:hypothetical protein
VVDQWSAMQSTNVHVPDLEIHVPDLEIHVID